MDESAWSPLSAMAMHTFQIGQITRIWAGIESSLDLSCHIAFHSLGADKKFSELPRPLNKRFSMLRRVLVDAVDDNFLPEHGVALIDCAVDAADFRHLCIHGLAMEDNGGFRIDIFKRLPKEYESVQKRITRQDVESAQVEGMLLSYGILNILIHIIRRAGHGDIPAVINSPRLPLTGINLHPNRTKRAKRIAQALQALSQR